MLHHHSPSVQIGQETKIPFPFQAHRVTSVSEKVWGKFILVFYNKTS